MKNNETHADTKTVAERAYQLFLARGGEHGHDLDDWVRAERELRQTRPTETTTPSMNNRLRSKR
jgi:hypothetical protein